jgi:hypothetical protein
MITVDFFTQQLYPQQIKPGNGKCLNSKWRSCWNGRPSVYGLQSVFSWCRFQPRHATCVLVFIGFLKHTVHCGFCLSLSLHPTLLASTDVVAYHHWVFPAVSFSTVRVSSRTWQDQSHEEWSSKNI